MGMLATVMNCLALEAALERRGQSRAHAVGAADAAGLRDLFSAQRAHEHLDEGRIVLFAGGTGNPFFTTDTTAVLRAAEMGARPCSRRPMSTASIAPIRRRIRRPNALTG